MLRYSCLFLARDPFDRTVFINAVGPQYLERGVAEGYIGDSCLGLVYAAVTAGAHFCEPRHRQRLFLAAPPRPLRRTKAALQPPYKPVMAAQGTEGPPGAEEALEPWIAARRARTDVLRQLVGRQGAAVLSRRDPQGLTAAHWAALEGHTEVLEFIHAAGGPVAAVSEHPLRQQPIHWACCNGHIPTIESLLRAGVDIDARDANGCTPLITACQYEQTAAAAFLMGKGAQLQACDAEGDNALHWAAFRGRPELVRLLVYSGFNAHQRDHQGQSALHLAAISGNLSTARDLVRIDRVRMEICDANGRTPLMLAKGRRHDDVAAFLRGEMERREGGLWAKLNLRSLAFGPPGKKREAQLLFLFISAVFMYPAYILKVAPLLFPVVPGLQWLFLACNLVAWVTFVKACSLDPGFLPKRQPEYDRIMRQVGNIEAWSSCGESVLDRLCHTCRLVKPFRAKHCRICDRCVRDMDHHCPYIYNCVGFGNRAWFFWFVYSVLAIAFLSFYFVYLVLTMRGFDFVIVLMLPMGVFGLLAVGAVGVCLWWSAIRNITANEMANSRRYSYMRTRSGGYRNPFDRGLITNLLEYFHCRAPLSLVDFQTRRIADIL